MSTSFSELRLTGWALGTLVVMAALFAYGQNHLGFTGGPIALPKLLWLATAIWAWYVQPILLLLDPRVQGVARQGITGLIALMGCRAIVEGIMLYATHNWNPTYGLLFNGLAIMWLGWAAWRGKGLLTFHLLVLALMFISESGFALYMNSQFVTAGESPIYFVPDDPRHQIVLQFTWAAVVAVWMWQIFFLRKWLWPR